LPGLGGSFFCFLLFRVWQFVSRYVCHKRVNDRNATGPATSPELVETGRHRGDDPASGNKPSPRRSMWAQEQAKRGVVATQQGVPEACDKSSRRRSTRCAQGPPVPNLSKPNRMESRPVEQVVAATTCGNKSSRRRSMKCMPRDHLSQTCRKPGNTRSSSP
jgi:hypothetical protein